MKQIRLVSVLFAMALFIVGQTFCMENKVPKRVCKLHVTEQIKFKKFEDFKDFKRFHCMLQPRVLTRLSKTQSLLVALKGLIKVEDIVLCIVGDNDWTVLSLAVDLGDVESVKYILGFQEPKNMVLDFWNQNPLAISLGNRYASKNKFYKYEDIKKNRFEIAKILVKAGAVLNCDLLQYNMIGQRCDTDQKMFEEFKFWYEKNYKSKVFLFKKSLLKKTENKIYSDIKIKLECLGNSDCDSK